MQWIDDEASDGGELDSSGDENEESGDSFLDDDVVDEGYHHMNEDDEGPMNEDSDRGEEARVPVAIEETPVPLRAPLKNNAPPVRMGRVASETNKCTKVDRSEHFPGVLVPDEVVDGQYTAAGDLSGDHPHIDDDLKLETPHAAQELCRKLSGAPPGALRVYQVHGTPYWTPCLPCTLHIEAGVTQQEIVFLGAIMFSNDHFYHPQQSERFRKLQQSFPLCVQACNWTYACRCVLSEAMGNDYGSNTTAESVAWILFKSAIELVKQPGKKYNTNAVHKALMAQWTSQPTLEKTLAAFAQCVVQGREAYPGVTFVIAVE